MRGAVECEGCLNKTKLEQIGPRDEVGSGGQGAGLPTSYRVPGGQGWAYRIPGGQRGGLMGLSMI